MARPRLSSLTLRLLSALLLAPAVLLALWFGRPWFDLLLVLAAGLMAREWAALVGAGRHSLLLVGLAGCLVLLPLVGLAIGWALLTALLCSLFIATLWRHSHRALWLAGGLLVASLPCLAAAWLRDSVGEGRAILFWSFLVVWATDTGAYAFGRLIGGAKLAPRISPNKTWAGFFGGLASAMAAGAAIGALAVAAGWVPSGLDLALLALASAGASVVGQGGDLAESALKRRFGAKDSGQLIPGHGGLLDRADSLLAVIPAVALVVGLTRLDVMLWA